MEEQRARRGKEADHEITSGWLPMNKLSSCRAFIFLFVLCVDVNEKIYTMCVIYTRITGTPEHRAEAIGRKQRGSRGGRQGGKAKGEEANGENGAKRGRNERAKETE